LGLSGLVYTGLALYYYVKSSFQQEHFDWKNCRRLFGILTLILGTVGLLYLFFPVTWDHYFGSFIYTIWSIFVFLTVYQYYLYSKQNIRSPNKFVVSVLISNVIIFLTYQLISTGWVQIYCAGGSLVFSFVLYANFLILFNKKYQQTPVKEINNRYSNKKISGEQADSFTVKLERLMDSEELYKNPNLKLSDLASRMNISAHQLSQLLNDNLGKVFQPISMNIELVKLVRKLKDGSYLKIEEIGYEVGFNSKSTFSLHLRK
jgi:AraC-like DNA-binding protein